MSDTETPEQWAENIVWRDNSANYLTRKAALAELAAVKRKADAAELWRAEALASYPVTCRESKDTSDYAAILSARNARIAAGLE